MRHIIRRIGVPVLGVLISLPVVAQRHRDPLNDKEVNELRDTNQEPNARIKLYVKFTRARMEAVEHLRSDKALAIAQSPQIGQLLDDVASLVDEIDDNLSMYEGRSEDLRKPLREVIEMDSDFQLKLRAIRETSTPEQLNQFGLALENATESVNSSADSARAMLDDQVAKKGKEKPEKQDKSAKRKGTDSTVDDKSRPDYTGMGGIGRDKPR